MSDPFQRFCRRAAVPPRKFPQEDDRIHCVIQISIGKTVNLFFDSLAQAFCGLLIVAGRDRFQLLDLDFSDFFVPVMGTFVNACRRVMD